MIAPAVEVLGGLAVHSCAPLRPSDLDLTLINGLELSLFGAEGKYWDVEFRRFFGSV